MKAYEWIRAWGRVVGSLNGHYVEAQIEQAREDGAPEKSIYKRSDGTWATVDDCCPASKAWIEAEMDAISE